MVLPRQRTPADSGDATVLLRRIGQVFRSAHSAPRDSPEASQLALEFRPAPGGRKQPGGRSPVGRRRARRGDRRKARHRTPDGSDPQGELTADGEVLVPLRPVRTGKGYRSVYSELTRVTVRSVILMASRVVGETLITCGLIVLLFAAYEVWGVGAKVNAHQEDLSSQLAQEWSAAPEPSVSASAAPPPPMDGAGIAKLYIPRIKSKPWVVVQGVTPEAIRYAPGHDPNTAMPGEIGNFVVAGHRTPAIFWDLDLMKPDDPIILETRDRWYVYRTVLLHVVSKNGVEILAPVPNRPGEDPEKAMLTLFTCYPKTGNEQRLVLHAELVDDQPHDAGYPAELGR